MLSSASRVRSLNVGCLTLRGLRWAQILVDGQDITKVDAQQFRRQLGVVSQDPHLLSMSIADNILYGLEEEGLTIDDVEAAARMANAHAFITAFPRGYQTMVTDKCATAVPTPPPLRPALTALLFLILHSQV